MAYCARLRRILLAAFAALMVDTAWLPNPLPAQEGGTERAPAPAPNHGSMSVTWSYSRSAGGCDPFGICTDDNAKQTFSGGASLQPVEGGFEGSGSGSYEHDTQVVTRPTTGCPNGAHNHQNHSGSADFVVHAQCSIDNPITGGPDTSQYDRDTSVVEVLVDDYDLHVEYDSRDCDGRPETWTSDDGAAGFGCFFYGVDFFRPGTYQYRAEVTEGTFGTCTLNFNPGAFDRLRVYGTVKGLTDGIRRRPPLVPISNARVVAMKFEEPWLEKLSSSKPNFKEKTSTTDDEEAEYEIVLPLCGESLRVIVVSLLWYEGPPEFAVTNGPKPLSRNTGIPVYVAACIDDDPTSECFKWTEAEDGYEAEVNFVYGDEDQARRQDTFMGGEDRVYLSSREAMMMESAYIYYNAYRGLKYFDHLALGYPKNELMIATHYTHESCSPTKKDRNPDNAAYHRDAAFFNQPPYRYGDLGARLEGVVAKGGAMIICPRTSAINFPDAPVNREWHELAHYFQHQNYYPRIACSGCTSHGGYENENTNRSLIEGFAEFSAALTNKYHGAANPNIYPVGDSAYNLELDFKPWGIRGDEDHAVAGILWDLYDPGREIALNHTVNGQVREISRVHPNPMDAVTIPEETIFQAIQQGKPTTVYELWARLWRHAPGVSDVDLDMIFLDHGFFADVEDRNYVHDSAGETIAESGSTSDPDRPQRKKPKPSLPGSYIVSDSDETFEVEISLLQDGGKQYNYNYQLDMRREVPAYFTMPPEYYPSKATISPVTDGKKGPAVLEISSEEYWQYIHSGPEESAVFRRIPEARND